MADPALAGERPAEGRFLLPGGWYAPDGQVYRSVVLRPLSGHEEEMLATASSGSTPALVTALLARCLEAIGPCHPVTPAMVRSLLVGDREYLMQRLRQVTVGSRVQATLTCPACHQPFDLEFDLDAIPVTRRHPERRYELDLDGAGRIAFRLPTGADQEALAAAAPADPEGFLLGRCVLDGEAGEPGSPVRLALDAAMAEAAPGPAPELEVACAECGQVVTAPLDMTDFFWREIGVSRQRLYQEVHFLALHYHWSEAEILAMPRFKRRLYIDLLVEAVRASGG